MMGTLNKRLKNLHSMMVSRCYDDKYLQRNPNYKGCTVSEDFYELENFMINIRKVSNFEVWATQEGWQLDKDLFVQNNKVYSVATCCFLPKKLNITFQGGGQKKGNDLPNGVVVGKARVGAATYIAQCVGDKGSNRHVGTYTTAEEAFIAYSKAKQRLVARLTFDYFEHLDDITIDKLLSYTPHKEYR